MVQLVLFKLAGFEMSLCGTYLYLSLKKSVGSQKKDELLYHFTSNQSNYIRHEVLLAVFYPKHYSLIDIMVLENKKYRS